MLVAISHVGPGGFRVDRQHLWGRETLVLLSNMVLVERSIDQARWSVQLLSQVSCVA